MAAGWKWIADTTVKSTSPNPGLFGRAARVFGRRGSICAGDAFERIGAAMQDIADILREREVSMWAARG